MTDAAVTTNVPGKAPASSSGPAASTDALASFLASMRYDDLSRAAVERTKMLFLDWLGSALAGAPSEPVGILARFAAYGAGGRFSHGCAVACDELAFLRRLA